MNCQEEKQKKCREGLKETEIWYSRQFQGCREESEHGTEKPKYIRKEVQKQTQKVFLRSIQRLSKITWSSSTDSYGSSKGPRVKRDGT